MARNKTTDMMFSGHGTFTKHTIMITFAFDWPPITTTGQMLIMLIK